MGVAEQGFRPLAPLNIFEITGAKTFWTLAFFPRKSLNEFRPCHIVTENERGLQAVQYLQITDNCE